MKKGSRIVALFALAIGLTSCSIFDFDKKSNSNTTQDTTQDTAQEELKDFEFIKDDKLTWREEDYGSFYSLTLVEGESYQIKSTIDDKLGNTYELKYEIDDESTGFTVSSKGLITADKSIDKTEIGSAYARLYKKGSSKIIKSQYVIVTIRKANEEYVEASINDEELDFDSSSKTYTLNLEAGDSYYIAINTKTNTEFKKEFSLTNDSYADFMSVNENGMITTSGEIAENKTGKVAITFRSTKTSVVLNTLYLVVNITPKGDVVENTLVVKNAQNSQEIKENDVLSLYVGEKITLKIQYNKVDKTNVISTQDSAVSIDGETNTITAVSAGEASIVVTVEDKSLTFKIQVQANPLDHIYAPNEGDDFVIHNGELHILSKVYAVYESGKEEEINLSNGLTYTITDSSSTHKSLVLSYTKDNVTKTVTYSVRFFVSKEYQGDTTAYCFKDYGRAQYAQCKYLLNEGNLKFLVIPVWFNNSSNFFTEGQKTQIKEDIQAKMLEEKTDTNYWSVKSYYEEESHGKLKISATVTDFYESDTSSVNYTDTGDSSATFNLAQKASEWYFENNPSDDISNYDADADGKVDSVILFYGANYYGHSTDVMRSVAYAWADSTNSRNYNTGAFCPIGGIYGFNKSSSTATQLEASDLSSVNPYAFIRGSNHLIHEIGHQFGAKDLYEYAAPGETKNYPAGQFSMQDNNIGSHDPYHMNVFGWTKPDIYASKDYDVGQQITIAVDDFQSSGNNIILSRNWNEYNSLFDEYMILELFTPTGLNEFDASRLRMNDVGFRVWHVNSLLDNGNQNIHDTGSQQIKNSNIDRTSEFDLVHLIRNDEDAQMDCQTGMKGSDLFKENDEFSVSKFSKQFVRHDRLDNEEKLGWDCKVEKIYQKEDGKYTGIVTLTRVDSTRTQFKAQATMSNDIPAPTGNTNEIGKLIFNNENVLMNYAFNQSEVYSGERAIDGKGISLFGAEEGDGGSLEISIKDKEGYTTYINSIKLVYYVMTNGVLKATVEGNELSYTSFEGPESDATSPDGSHAHNIGRIYEVNAKSVKLQNCFKGTINHLSRILIQSIEVEYSLIPNN